MDNLTRAERSRHMARIRSVDSKPEFAVRRMVHRMGFRYRLHDKSLPGTPDLVFPARRKVIFVNGCFWHGHNCRAGRNRPSTNKQYWEAKLGRNIVRDRTAKQSLHQTGWKVRTVWECQVRNNRLPGMLRRFLKDNL